MRRNSNLPWLVGGLLGVWLGTVGARVDAQVAEPSTAATLFSGDETIALRLEAPFATLRRGGPDSEPEYQPARLSYTAPSGETVATDLRVRVRGKSRLALCSFPPLLLNFRTRDLVGTTFEGQDRLKLVTHCEPRAGNAQYIFLEYLAYRVLNLVTDESLRARPVTVTYFDTERGREIATGPGILLEDEEQFAARRAFTTIAEEKLTRARYDEQALMLIETFQYFIGNTDWSAIAGPAGSDCCHNVVPLARADGVLVPIVYDFDSSGIVDAAYALPDARLPINTVRDRLYRGACLDADALRATFAPFEARRAEIRSLFEQHPQLAARSRERALEYVDAFYASISEPRRVERDFRSSCPR
jgi:hypothetical protein